MSTYLEINKKSVNNLVKLHIVFLYLYIEKRKDKNLFIVCFYFIQ